MPRARTRPASRAMAGRALRCGVAVALWVLATAAQAAPEIHVDRDGDRFTVSATALLDADAKTAWDTLTDYERLPQFVPGITRTRIVQAQPQRPVIEYEGEFRVYFFRVPVRLRLAATHEPIVRVLAESAPATPEAPPPSMKNFRGRYELAVVRAGSGAGARSAVRLDYHAQFELAEPLPPVLGALFGTAAVRRTMGAQFEAMTTEIERRARARPAIERAGG
ncbi:MAG: SRPBCC family protein [Rubrivivax sp.]|jgi:hypothetical protein|nr:SRPBCC family protein [Rubrivivax sp.]